MLDQTEPNPIMVLTVQKINEENQTRKTQSKVPALNLEKLVKLEIDDFYESEEEEKIESEAGVSKSKKLKNIKR